MMMPGMAMPFGMMGNQRETINEIEKVDPEYERIVEERRIKEKEEKLDELHYGKIVTVSMYVSAWLLSCVLLYTYNSKRASLIRYNKMMRDINTKKLNESLAKYNSICQEYASTAYPSQTMVGVQEDINTGVVSIRKRMYKELIKSLELYEKCNYIKLNTSGAPFPMSEIMISGILLVLILSIIVVSNLSNNPFQKLTLSDEMDEVSKMISSAFDDSQYDDKKVQKGGGSDDNTDYDAMLEELSAREMAIKKKISFLKGDSTFNYVSLAFCIVIFTFYLSFKMLISSSRFTDNLYSGNTFLKSRCYDF